MDGELRGGALRIGEMARASGLTVSALRFYDGAGVLVPAAVDPATGYRTYGAGRCPRLGCSPASAGWACRYPGSPRSWPR